MAAPVLCLYLIHTVIGVWTGPEDEPHRADMTAVSDNQGLHENECRASILDPIKKRLVEQFDRSLTDPKAFFEKVRSECAMFPEGDLFPFVFPALAYANLALDRPEQNEHALRQIAKLIELAIPAVVERVRPPGGRIENLTSYKGHATYLGQLNLALGAYRLAGGERFAPIHRRITHVLQRALEAADGKPLRSFPSYSWPFDTIPVLVSLKLYDALTAGSNAEALISRHLAWIEHNAMHESLGLPLSRLGRHSELPRGCDLSLRLMLMPHIDRPRAEAWHEKYVASYWLERGIAAGFAEWPEGIDRYEDNDSGPIFLGIGLAATGLGIGTLIAMNDEARLERLCSQLAVRDVALALLVVDLAGQKKLGGMIPFDPQYFTGFLYGDAILFYAITWREWVR